MRIVLLLGEWTCYRDIEEKGHPRWSKPVPTSRRQDSPSSGYSHSPQDGDFVRFDGHFTGNAMADFLLGDAQSYSQLNQRLTPYYDYYQIELYAQDTWRVTPRLTVNIGVRYFYIPHLYEEKNLLYNFLPGKYNPSEAVTVQPDGSIQPNSGNTVNGVVGVKDGLPRDLVHNYPWTFGPRFGFAYDPTGQTKWAIRGCDGIGYFRTQGNDSYAMVGKPPGAATVTVYNPSLNNAASGQARRTVPIQLQLARHELSRSNGSELQPHGGTRDHTRHGRQPGLRRITRHASGSGQEHKSASASGRIQFRSPTEFGLSVGARRAIR